MILHVCNQNILCNTCVTASWGWVDDCHSQEGFICNSLVSYQHGFSSYYTVSAGNMSMDFPSFSPLSLNHEFRTITPLCFRENVHFTSLASTVMQQKSRGCFR